MKMAVMVSSDLMERWKVNVELTQSWLLNGMLAAECSATQACSALCSTQLVITIEPSNQSGDISPSCHAKNSPYSFL